MPRIPNILSGIQGSGIQGSGVWGSGGMPRITDKALSGIQGFVCAGRPVFGDLLCLVVHIYRLTHFVKGGKRGRKDKYWHNTELVLSRKLFPGANSLIILRGQY